VKNIFFIRSDKGKYGGAEVYLSRLSNALDGQNIKHEIINSIFPKFLPSWLRVVLFNLQVCSTKRGRLYFSLDRITCPDIYRAGDGVHKEFLKIKKKSKLNPLHPVYLFLEKRCFNNAKRIIANSNMIKDEIISTYGIDAQKIDVVYNGVESKIINHESSFKKLSKEFYLDKNSKILLYVGSGFKRKGVEEFLEIISRLKNKNIKAFVIGKEKNIEHYKQLSKDFKIDKNVIFTGPRDDVDDFYTISDIFLFPTRYEPFSNVVLEAMSFENAVFTTQQNGASEILSREFIMDNSQDFSVVDKIDKLLLDKKTLKEIQKSNKSKSKQFSIEKNLSETLKVINEIIN
jgi:UDP-glucose:(heptosyl)LPS alpha-1,3-glucosyltransferase